MLGICGLVVLPLVCSVLAVIFGNQAKREIRASGGAISGGGLAKAGVILGWIGIALLVLLVVAVAIVLLTASTIN